LERQYPAFGGLDRIAGPEDGEIGNGTQCPQMLDRLMGRSILTEPDRVMRHHIDDTYAHERRKADRGAAIIGKAQEGAAIGYDAAMERKPAHRRRHRMLANAVMDVAAAIIGGGQELQVLRPRIVGAGEIGRAAY